SVRCSTTWRPAASTSRGPRSQVSPISPWLWLWWSGWPCADSGVSGYRLRRRCRLQSSERPPAPSDLLVAGFWTSLTSVLSTDAACWPSAWAVRAALWMAGRSTRLGRLPAARQIEEVLAWARRHWLPLAILVEPDVS